MAGGLGEVCRVRFLPTQLVSLALLIGCGSGEAPPPSPVEPAPASVAKPVVEPVPEAKPAPEPIQPTAPPLPVAEPAPAPPPEPESAKLAAPAPAPEINPAPEPVTAAPSIRKPERERFIEEHRLELKDQRWHVLSEPEPYTGQTKRWTVEGWKQAEGGYLNGLQHGRWKTWWDNGNLRSAIEFDSGKPNGSAIHWHANGQRKTEGTFVNGKFTAKFKWDENGESLTLEPATTP